MRPLLSIACLLLATASPIDLSGHWDLDGSNENYNITGLNLAGGQFTVLCVGGPCTAWKTASLNITYVSSLAYLVCLMGIDFRYWSPQE